MFLESGQVGRSLPADGLCLGSRVSWVTSTEINNAGEGMCLIESRAYSLFTLLLCSHITRTTQWEDPRKQLQAQQNLVAHQSADSILRSPQQAQPQQPTLAQQQGECLVLSSKIYLFLLFSVHGTFNWESITRYLLHPLFRTI